MSTKYLTFGDEDCGFQKAKSTDKTSRHSGDRKFGRIRKKTKTHREEPGKEGTKGHAPNPAEIRVFSVGKSLKIEPVKIPENPLEIGRA